MAKAYVKRDLTVGKDYVDTEGGSGGGGTSYSTEEKVIGTWIDGSKLYQKVIVLENIVANAWIGVVIENFNELTGYNCVCHSETYSQYLSLTSNDSINTNVSGFSVGFLTRNSDISDVKLTIEYTKAE